MGYVVAVDLGTTFTAAAVSNGSRPTMVGLGNRALQVPSVLFRTDEGFLVGESAERRGLTEPDRVVREFKRRLGDDVPVLVDGGPFAAAALMAGLLAWVLERTSERMGEQPGGLVLTHPAGWRDHKLERLREVVEQAGASTARFCPEPTAAAAQYASRARVRPGDRLAVYDLGGGTFDVCVLEKSATGFRVLGTPEGVERLGGVDFDALLFTHVLGLLGDRVPLPDPDDTATTNAFHRLRRDCVDAKEALSSDVETTVPVALPGLVTSVRLTRGELESLLRPSVQQSVEAMARALRWAEVEPSELRAIILVGGSSRIPLVGELLQAAFRVPVALDTHPKHDIALGALRDAQVAPSAPSVAVAAPVPVSAPVPAPAPAPVRSPTPAPAAPPVPVPAPVAVVAPAAPPPTVEPAEVLVLAPGVPPSGPSPRWRRNRWVLAVPVVVVALAAAGIGTGLWVRDRASAGASADPVSPVRPPSSPTPAADGDLPVAAALSPDQLVVSVLGDEGWDLWLASVDQPAPVLRLTSDPAPDTTPVLSPDARTLIYTHTVDGLRILMVKAASTAGDGRPLFDAVPPQCAGTVMRPAWDPVRRDEVAVPCVDAAGKQGIYQFTTSGRLVREVPLPTGTTRLDDPSYAPDGSRLAFWAAPASTWDGGTLYTVGVDGGRPEELQPTTRAGEDADPVWSPDGRSIVFRRRMDDGSTSGNLDIFRTAADGSGKPERLTKGRADEQDPIYSPSGEAIAYKSAERDPARPAHAITRAWVMDADGGNRRPLWSQGRDDEQTTTAWGRR